MGKLVFSLLLTVAVSWTIMPSINAQRSIQQYLHLSGLPYSTLPIPATTTATTNNLATSSSPTTSQARPTTGIPSFAALSLPSMIVPASHPQTELPCETPSAKDSKIDGKLLNNLAIALQMLILSNILNSSPTDTASEKCKTLTSESPLCQSTPQNNLSPPQTTYNPPQTSYSLPQSRYSPPEVSYSQPQTTHSSQPSYSHSQTNNSPPQYIYSQPQTTHSSQPSYSHSQTNSSPPQYIYSQPQNSYSSSQNTYIPTQTTYSPTQTQYFSTQPEHTMPSANLVGVPNFSEPQFEQTLKRTRGNFNLMSPYEALAQPYSDASSSYMPSISRRDFQSPYAMIDTNMDFFPMNDLF